MNPLLENLPAGAALSWQTPRDTMIGNDLRSGVSSKPSVCSAEDRRRVGGRLHLGLPEPRGPDSRARAGVARIQDKAGTARRPERQERAEGRAPARPTSTGPPARVDSWPTSTTTPTASSPWREGAAKFAKVPIRGLSCSTKTWWTPTSG